ncbi:EthD domain-containing protein [Novosphingobium sp. RD2P27]|uniref:EthD domain-containing protein n=1 Tax=Novosphingobium kalidii TaxID=3230299 RepID=A0ABV2D467_9SPHN
MFKQICFFRKRPDMSLDEFMDYYENQHSQLAKKMGAKPALPNAVRYVRRYLTPETNPVTGEVHDCGYDCIMEIWWSSREDFEASQRIISDPARLPMTIDDEKKLFASHANPIVSCVEFDSPMGPNGEPTRAEVRHGA